MSHASSSRKRRSKDDDDDFQLPTEGGVGAVTAAGTSPLRRSSRKRKVRHIVMDDPEEEEGEPVVIKVEDLEVTGAVKAETEEASVQSAPTTIPDILNEPGTATYVVDEVKLLHQSTRPRCNKVYLMCPVCGSIDTHKQLGHHLFSQHKANFLRCPGNKCGGWRVRWTELQRHVEEKHFGIDCADCNVTVDVRKLIYHRNICKKVNVRQGQGRQQQLPSTEAGTICNKVNQVQDQQQQSSMEVRTIIRPQTLQKVLKSKPIAVTLQKPVPLILQQRSTLEAPKSSMSVMIPSKVILTPTEVGLKEHNVVKNPDYEILLGGKLVIIDGLHFYIKGDVAFTDCPLCEDRSMAVSVIGSHLLHDHKFSHVSCPVKSCSLTSLQSTVFQEHLLKQHGRLTCNTCCCQVDIMSVGDHFDTVSGACMALKTTAASRSITYDVETLTPTHKDLQTFSDETAKSTPLMLDLRKSSPAKLPTIPCPHCGKQCSYLKKHIRDVHQPKTNCPICARRMGHSYLSEHMKIQHQGKEVPTKKCPLCGVNVQKLKNHLKATHRMTKTEADEIHEQYYPMAQNNSYISKTQIQASRLEKDRQFQKIVDEDGGCPIPETILDVAEDRILVFDD